MKLHRDRLMVRPGHGRPEMWVRNPTRASVSSPSGREGEINPRSREVRFLADAERFGGSV